MGNCLNPLGGLQEDLATMKSALATLEESKKKIEAIQEDVKVTVKNITTKVATGGMGFKSPF